MSLKKTIKKLIKQYNDEATSKIKVKDFKKEISSSGIDVDDDELDKVTKKFCDEGVFVLDGKYIVFNRSSDRNATENSNQTEKPKEKKRPLDDTENESSGAKRQKSDPQEEVDRDSTKFGDLWKNGEKYHKEGMISMEYSKNNPDGITRIFCGNLNKAITEEKLRDFLPGITYIRWITDKTTKEFYGSTFVELKDPHSASEAVMKNGMKLMGRPVKIYYCPPKPGDIWPPVNESKPSGSSGGAARKREKTPKPENAKKLFMGNLAYTIQDDNVYDFFKDCGEIVGLRWLTNFETGEFRVSNFFD